MTIEKIKKDGYTLYRPAVDPGAKNCRPETPEQIDFVAWVRCNYPKMAGLMFHCPSEGERTPQYRQQLYKMGLDKGVSDLIFLCNGGAAFEFKKCSHSSKASAEQIKFLQGCEREGMFTAVCNGAAAGKAAFLEWMESEI